MRQKGKKIGSVLLAVLALVLVMNFSVGESMAYFTTYATARGGYWLTLESSSKIRERMVEWDKHIQVENTGETSSFVRVKIFAGSAFGLLNTDNASGKWQKEDDGYWYYSEPVAPGTMTEELVISIKVPEEHAASFNVTVIQESTPVLYDENGVAYADWTMEAEVTTNTQDIPVGEGGQGDE